MNTNENICGVATGNTGVTGCGVAVNPRDGFIILPRGKSYATAGYTSDALFLTALKADTLLASKTARIYPFLQAIDFVDNTGDNTLQAASGGAVRYTHHDTRKFMYTFPSVGINVVQALKKFEGNNNICALFAGEGYLHGKKLSNGNLTGEDCTVSVMYKAAAGTNTYEATITFTLVDNEAFYSQERYGFYKFDAGTVLKDELSGVHDVVLELVSSAAASIVVKCRRRDNLKDMGVDYEASLELPAAWLCITAAGVVQAPTTVTYSATAGTFTLAGTFADGYLSLYDPTTLAALTTALGNGQTGGFESNRISFAVA